MILSAFKNRAGQRTELPSWQSRLQDANQILHELAASTEGEFIKLGERFQDFYFRTRGLSDLSSQVAECLSGEELQQHMEGLQAIFSRVQEQDELSRKGVSMLSSLLSRFETIDGLLARFDQTTRNLHVLCNFIKIESSRLGSRDTGFTTLGEDVRKLADNITEKSAELTRQAETLAEMIRQGLQRITDFEKKQQVHARSILDQSVQSLSAMSERHQSSSDTLAEIATRWKRISQSIGEVVSSMQFHDITRQRLEHVRDGLKDVGEKLAPAPQKAAPQNPPRFLRFFRKPAATGTPPPAGLADAVIPCQVQCVQLKDADADMMSAVERIIRNLNQIASEITVMAGETRKLAGAGTRQEDSFLSDLEKKLSSLATALDSYGEINREWSASMEQVTSSARDMTVFIREIDKIGIRMRLISLNASIHAAHLGQEGAALGILAESISRLSNETSRKIDDISGALKAVMKEAGSVASLQTDPPEGPFSAGSAVPAPSTRSNRADGMSARIIKMLDPLRQMDANVAGLLSRINQDADTLTRDIETTAQGISVHRKMSGGIQKVILDVESMVETMRTLCPATGSDHPEMADMTDRYTMEREREIHAAIAGTAAAAAVIAGQPPAATASEAVTDNVELLDDVFFEDVLFTEDAAPQPTPIEIMAQAAASDAEWTPVPPEEAPSPPEMQSSESAPSAESGEDLGDNVELF